MSYNAIDEGSLPLRLEFHVANAVHQRGFFAVMLVALAAWWNRPRIPADLPARLRADMGLPPAPRSMFWPDQDDYWPLQMPMWPPPK